MDLQESNAYYEMQGSSHQWSLVCFSMRTVIRYCILIHNQCYEVILNGKELEYFVLLEILILTYIPTAKTDKK